MAVDPRDPDVDADLRTPSVAAELGVDPVRYWKRTGTILPGAQSEIAAYLGGER